jgi:predicted metal-dependent peptidase
VDTLADDHYQVVKVPPKPPGGGGNGQGSGHGGFDKHLPPSQNAPSPQQVKRAVAQARNAAKAQGKMPADLERLVDGLIEPKHDWKEQLANVMASALGRDSATWAKPNRRRLATWGLYLPGTIGYSTAEVAVVIDTSGSISDKELKAFLSELSGILEQAKPRQTKVFWTDSRVAGVDEVDEFTDLTKLKPKGGGGTDMEAAWEVIADEMDTTEVTAVVLTDGWTDSNIDNKPAYPVVWVTTDKDKFAYGDVIKMEEK